jgi:hypothetical protein
MKKIAITVLVVVAITVAGHLLFTGHMPPSQWMAGAIIGAAAGGLALEGLLQRRRDKNDPAGKESCVQIPGLPPTWVVRPVMLAIGLYAGWQAILAISAATNFIDGVFSVAQFLVVMAVCYMVFTATFPKKSAQ